MVRPAKVQTQKDKVLVAVASEHYGVTKTATLFGLKPSQVTYWREHPTMQPYLEATREKVLEEITPLTQAAWAFIGDRLTRPSEISNRDLLSMADSLTTKMLLLSGQATSRTEHRDVTDVFDDAEMQEFVNRARDYLRRNGPRAGTTLVAHGPVEAPPAQEPDSA